MCSLWELNVSWWPYLKACEKIEMKGKEQGWERPEAGASSLSLAPFLWAVNGTLWGRHPQVSHYFVTWWYIHSDHTHNSLVRMVPLSCLCVIDTLTGGLLPRFRSRTSHRSLHHPSVGSCAHYVPVSEEVMNSESKDRHRDIGNGRMSLK